MANKYKEYSLKKDAQVGEVVETYGVKFINNPEYKPHMHNQSRPYLVLHKEESGKFLALKLTSKIRGYMSEFKIYPKKYKDNNILKTTSAADLRFIVELEAQDITKNGFVLDPDELNILYSKLMNQYVLNETQISDEHANIIFNYYIKNRKISSGTVIRTKYYEDYLLVIEKVEDQFKCLPLHRYKSENATNEIKILRQPSYVDFNEEYYIEESDIFYIMSFQTDKEIMNYIKKSIKLIKEHNLSK